MVISCSSPIVISRLIWQMFWYRKIICFNITVGYNPSIVCAFVVSFLFDICLSHHPLSLWESPWLIMWSLSWVERQATVFKLLTHPPGMFLWGFSFRVWQWGSSVSNQPNNHGSVPSDRRVDKLGQTCHREMLTMPSWAVPVCVIRLYIPADKKTLN